MKFPKITQLPPAIQTDIRQRQAAQEQRLQTLQAAVLDESLGFFGPESMTWQLYREPSILLGGMRALLLQISHPAIAAGVGRYSNFQKDTLGRAHRTFTSMIHLWFGDVTIALRSARRLYQIHSMIRGTAVWATEDDTFTNPFCAADPDLLLWVHATLIDTTLVVFEKTVRPLSKKEKNQFYEESKITAQLMGIPLEDYPSNLDAFYSYYNTQLQGKMLCVGQAGADIAKELFRLPYPFRVLLKTTAVGLLPESISHQFQLKNSRSRQLLFQILLKATRWGVYFSPDLLRHAPPWFQGKYRIAKAQGKPTRFMERLHHWMGKNIKLYFIYNQLVLK